MLSTVWIHWSLTDNEATILTSAKVLFKPKDPEFKFHLIIRMGDGTVLFGKEDQVDFYHNLLTLKVKSKVELEVLDLRSRQAQIVHGMEVISLGRSFYSSSLYDSFGNLYEEHPNLGCDELLKSSCGIREICVKVDHLSPVMDMWLGLIISVIILVLIHFRHP